MKRIPLLKHLSSPTLCIAVAALSFLAVGGTSHADLFWAPSGNTEVAASGTWDSTTPNWQAAPSSPGTQQTWTQNSDAVFRGGPSNAAAQTVTFGTTPLTINSITFSAGAGTYNFVNPGANPAPITIIGSTDPNHTPGGIANLSSNTQTFDIGNGPLNFQNSATAGGSGSPVAITSSGTIGVVNFNDTSDAGSALISNVSQLNFNGGSGPLGSSASQATINNVGSVNFNNNSDAAASTINTGSGTVNFNDNSTGGTATVTVASDGQLNVSGSALGAVSLDSINASGKVTLGTTALTLKNTLTLNSGSAFDFNLDTVSGAVSTDVVTGGPLTPGSILLNLTLSNFVAGQPYSLINFNTNTVNGGLTASDFAVGGDLNGYTATVTVDSNSVDVTLTAVPEISSFAMPIAGALALFWFRRRSAGSSVPLPSAQI